MKLLIVNIQPYHYEIIESVIVKHQEILTSFYLQFCNKYDIKNKIKLEIYLYIYDNPSFKQYISNKYPEIKFLSYVPNNMDYYINCTIYDKDYSLLDNTKNSRRKYISHEITERLKGNPNVYFLTPMSKRNFIYADIMPYSGQKRSTNIPVYVVQGNLNQGRRCLNLLNKILNYNYEYDFKIKIIGRGYLPKELEKHKSKIVLKNNLNFIDFHKEFLDVYCILPLISKKTHKSYYSSKLTSSINYARGYKLKCLIDKDLQEIYELDNVEVYNDKNDIVEYFLKTLDQFYTNRELQLEK